MFLIKDKRGFGILEIVLVVGILIGLMVFGLSPFSAIKNRQSLNMSIDRIESLLSEARTLTTSAMNSSQYGVRFDTTSVTLFSGDVYVETNPDNKTIYIGDSAQITSIDLANSAYDVVFNRITGETNNPGTIVVTSVSDPNKSKIITIYRSGAYFTE